MFALVREPGFRKDLLQILIDGVGVTLEANLLYELAEVLQPYVTGAFRANVPILQLVNLLTPEQVVSAELADLQNKLVRRNPTFY